jgi:hypothetical protein
MYLNRLSQLLHSLKLALAGLRLGLKNRQVGEKWVSDDYAKVSKLKQISVPIPINMTFMLCLIPKHLKTILSKFFMHPQKSKNRATHNPKLIC